MERSPGEAADARALAPRRRLPGWVYVVFFAATAVWTWSAGVLMAGDDATRLVPWPWDLWSHPDAWRQGFPYALGVMLILGAHEMGHYVACRRYGIDATLPFFLPAPNPFGTFGAVIRIRSAFPSRRALFDVGIAGPIAGFVVALPVLLYGLSRSSIGAPPAAESLQLSSCLLLDWLYPLFLPVEGSVQLHPAAVAGWLGLFVTSLNLIPLAQLDGGHILHAIAPRWHERWSRVMLVLMAAVGAASGGYHLVLFALVFATVGVRHPPTFDDVTPLGAGRRLLALVAAILFAITFIAAPIRIA